MELVQAVESLIDEGLMPEVVPEDGRYSFEVDASILVELFQAQGAAVVSVSIAHMAQIERSLAQTLERWLGLSLANMATKESVLSCSDASGLVTLHRVLNLGVEQAEGLLAAMEELLSEVEEYRALLEASE